MAPLCSRRSLRTPPRATRAKPVFSYAESTSDSEVNEDVEGTDSEADNSPVIRHRQVPSPHRKPLTQSKKRFRPINLESEHEIKRNSRSKKRKQPKSSAPKFLTSIESSSCSVQTSGVIPRWQSLPYHIFVQIFQYATYPLYDDYTFQPLPSGSWLLKVARLCRSFSEPAFTVLLMTPPLVPMDKAHKLVEIMKADPRTLAFKYRQKVESLRIDVDQVAAYSLPGSGHLDLYDLVKNLPRLKDLEFYHRKDMSPYRDLDTNIKWSYPANLFDAMEYVDPDADSRYGDKTGTCKLRSWRWSSRLAGKTFPVGKIQEVHLKPSFELLRKLVFVNYQVPYWKATEEDPKHEKILAESLSPLKNLEHLVFESSTLVNSILLPLLPKNLRNFELINCWNIKAEELADFLLIHGSQLRCLTLNHNQSLSLSFLPILGAACPKLQVFRMKLNFFQLHSTYRDSDPLYDQLILPGQVPVWPWTLQTIELIQLRKWETEAAEMFFQSLLDSAADLPDLRRLTLQAILNIGWRDRASFRDKWVGSLDRVFKRVPGPPEKHVSIYRSEEDSPTTPPVPKQIDERSQEVLAEKRKSLRSSSGSTTLSSMASVIPEEPERSKQAEKAKEASSPPSRRSARTSSRQIRRGTYAESPENSDIEDVNFDTPSAREVARNARAVRELATLRQTAGRDLHPSSPPQTPSEDGGSDDDVPLVKLFGGKGKGKATEVIQGMCEVVDVRIDNLRPRETHVTEADFLDEEAPGDGDWNGDDDIDDDYAW